LRPDGHIGPACFASRFACVIPFSCFRVSDSLESVTPTVRMTNGGGLSRRGSQRGGSPVSARDSARRWSGDRSSRCAGSSQTRRLMLLDPPQGSGRDEETGAGTGMQQMETAQPFGKYLLMECVAVGGMAEIFRAKTVGADGFEKEVAIKRILPSYSEDDGFVTMFKDEAKIAAQLDHANIVKVFDFDEVAGDYYIAMEYIRGRDL